MSTFEVSIFDLLVLLGSMQGVILGIILIVHPKYRRRSNIYLAALLFTFSMLNFEGYLNNDLIDDMAILHGSFHIFCFTPVPVCLYFFVKYLLRPQETMNRYEKMFFLLIPIEFSIRHLSKLLGYETYAAIISMSTGIIESICILATILVLAHAIKSLGKHESLLLNQYSEVEEKSLKWLRNTFIAGAFLNALWMLIYICSFHPEFNYLLGYSIWIGISILIYWVGYMMLIQQGLLQSSVFGIADGHTESNHKLSPKTDEYYQRIISLVESKQLYLDPDLSMTKLAELTELSNGYISQIINTKGSTNFFDFINQYRVDEVIQKMKDEDYDHYTILSMAMDSGFKSKSTFNTVFKKSTGKTPSSYRKSLKSDNN